MKFVKVYLRLTLCCLYVFVSTISMRYSLVFDEMLIIFSGVYQELDFLVEAKNSVKCMDNFRKLSPHIADYVYAPRVYWTLSTSKLLTMEFMDAAQINDVKTIQTLGIRPRDVAKLVSFKT